MIKKTKMSEYPKDVEDLTITIDATDEVLDAYNSVVPEPTQAEERAVALQLEGTPHPFDAASVRVLECLAKRGIAANFGEGQWARGYNWHKYNNQSRGR